MNKLALIIGAGIHGIMTAIELSQSGFIVTIIDKNSDILEGTSGATHNRAHMGYHYPRSINTGNECLRGLTHFKERFPSVIYHGKSYYMIEKSGKTTMNEYRFFCDKLGIPFNEEIPPKKFIKSESLEGGIITAEPIFDIKKLKQILKNQLAQYNINFINNTYLTADIIKTIGADIIINATYAYSNNILKILGLGNEIEKYNVQHTEVIVVQSKRKIPCMTIMDGKFVSIMKHAGTVDQYLLYDAKNSVLHQEEYNYLPEIKHESNYHKIIDHFKEYFPFMDDLKFVESWYGTRPIPAINTDDSRTTSIKQHIKYDNIYSILKGKFISATLVAEQLKNIIVC